MTHCIQHSTNDSLMTKYYWDCIQQIIELPILSEIHIEDFFTLRSYKKANQAKRKKVLIITCVPVFIFFPIEKNVRDAVLNHPHQTGQL